MWSWPSQNMFVGTLTPPLAEQTDKMWLKGELCTSCFHQQLLNYNKEMKITT